ncbi:MAG: HET-C-related protein [bacterium]
MSNRLRPLHAACLCVCVASVTAHAAGPGSGSAQADLEYTGIERRVSQGVGDRILLVGPADETKRFVLTYHEKLSKVADAECTGLIDRGHWLQDIFLQPESRVHFDNCAFDDGAEFVDEMVTVVREQGQMALKDSGARRQALLALGRALHTLQDFYAHSNYVELMDGSAPPGDPLESALPIVPLWTTAGKTRLHELQSRGLVSGTWPIGLPKRCPSGAPTHTALAKDDLTTKAGEHPLAHSAVWGLKTGFQASFYLAQRATGAFIQDVVPPELMASCKGGFGALVLVSDVRASP